MKRTGTLLPEILGCEVEMQRSLFSRIRITRWILISGKIPEKPWFSGNCGFESPVHVQWSSLKKWVLIPVRRNLIREILRRVWDSERMGDRPTRWGIRSSSCRWMSLTRSKKTFWNLSVHIFQVKIVKSFILGCSLVWLLADNSRVERTG